MSKFELSIFDPNTLLPHRAGIAGLALVLSTLNPDDAPISWEITENTVTLNWDCDDRKALDWLIKNTYQIDSGMLTVPALNLSEQGKYTFSQGVTSTFLQNSMHRTLDKTARDIPFKVDEDKPEIIVKHRDIIDCYYLKDFKDAFNNKNQFRPSITIKGHHFPGIIECYINGAYKDSPSGFIALLFLPIACNYYRLENWQYALVIPEVKNLKCWVNRRRQLSNRSYRDFWSSSAGESGLKLLLEETLADSLQMQKVDYCEVYRLGKQPWDSNQSGLKQAVYRVRASNQVLSIYQSAVSLFPNRVALSKKKECFLGTSKALTWISENLVNGDTWYAKFYEFRKFYHDKIKYQKKGLIAMTSHLQSHEQILFDSVQGAFSVYLVGQNKQANKQGRPLDYFQVTDKVIHRLQKPSTQQDFATALVNFLTQFRSKASKGLGADIYAWIYGKEWRKARDLTMLAIATYQSKKKDGIVGSDEDLTEISDFDSVTETNDEGYEETL